MTTSSTHTYTAVLDDDTLLSPKGGQITLDASATVHAEATLVLAVEDTALLASLDPRDSRRVVISAQRDALPPRVFDLGIRSASPARADGTVTLELASDEALAKDFAQLEDDRTPREHEASIRAVCDYVLDKIGAAVEPGLDDANVTAYWPITNQITNPSMEVDASGWLGGTGASALARVNATAVQGSWSLRWTAGAGESNVVPVATNTTFYNAQPGRWYVFAGYVASGVARQARAAIQWWSTGGSVPSATSYGTLITSNAAEFTRAYVIAQCPPGADRMVPYISTLGNASGDTHYVDCVMLYEGDELVPYFDGSTVDDADYEYEFQASAHASTSTRTPIIERRPEALVWRAGVSGMDFLRALLLTTGLRLVCDEQRRWTLRSDLYRADGSQAWRYGVNITAADESVSRDDDTWFDAAVYGYTWTDDDGIVQTRTDAYSLTTSPTKVLRRELSIPYPGPGRARHIVNRAQGRGRTITVSGIPSWTEQTDQSLSILLDGTPIQTGITERVRFDLDTDEVTATSRTTDTPAGAIDLLAGTINALTGTIDNL